MLQHLILGLLRQKQQSWAYDLKSEYQRLSGNVGNAGNMSKELRRLRDEGLVTPQSNAPGEDERRVPYAITPKGCRVIDEWLTSQRAIEEDFDTWLTFLHLVPSDTCDRQLERLQDELWLHSKRINRAYEDALEARTRGQHDHASGEMRLLRQMKQISADLDFILELRNGRRNGRRVDK